MVEIIKPSWNKIEEICKKLSREIEKEFQPDFLIGIARGGLVPLRLFSDLLDNSNVNTIKIEHYTGIQKRNKKPKIIQPLTVNIDGEKILVIDDVSDTGNSLKEAVRYLKTFRPLELKAVTLHYKPDSIYKPDYFGESTEAWIVYPWEKKEFARLKKNDGI